MRILICCPGKPGRFLHVKITSMKRPDLRQASSCALVLSALLAGCGQPAAVDPRIRKMDSARVAGIATAIEGEVKPVLAEGLTMQLWGSTPSWCRPSPSISTTPTAASTLPPLTGKRTPNSTSAGTANGRSLPSAWPPWKTGGSSCMKNYPRKQPPQQMAHRPQWRQLARLARPRP